MGPHVPQETWDNITQYLPSLEPLNLAFRFNFVLSPEQQNHARVWRMLFQSDQWLKEAECQSLNPCLVGYDLQYCYLASETNQEREKYLVLRLGDESGAFTKRDPDKPKLFFSCLRPHEFDKAAKVIHFKNKLAVHIGAVFDGKEVTRLPDLSKLFSEHESRYLLWQSDKYRLGRFGHDEIAGLHGYGWSSGCVLYTLSFPKTSMNHPSYNAFLEDGSLIGR